MALEESRYISGVMSDQRYNTDGISEYFKRLSTSGLWSLSDNLKVVLGSGLQITINYGAAVIDGYIYKLRDNNTGMLTLTLDTANASLPRIDRIVLCKDVTNQRVYAYIKKGTAAASPSPPALDTTTNYEISLGKITVAAGASSLTAGNLTDERALITIPLAGNVYGPVSNTDGYIPLWDGSNSKKLKNGLLLDSDGALNANSDTRLPSQKAVKTYADSKIPLTYIDIDGILTANSDSKIASQKATKSYVDNSANNLNNNVINYVNGYEKSTLTKCINRQDNTTNSSVSNQLIQTGWGYITGSSVTYTTKAISFPVAFDNVPIIIINYLGFKTSVPSSEADFSIGTQYAYGIQPTITGFLAAVYSRDSASNLTSSYYYGFSWIAIGTKSR